MVKPQDRAPSLTSPAAPRHADRRRNLVISLREWLFPARALKSAINTPEGRRRADEREVAATVALRPVARRPLKAEASRADGWLPPAPVFIPFRVLAGSVTGGYPPVDEVFPAA